MKKVELREMEETKYLIIKNLVDNGGDKKRAAIKLDLTVRQVNRLINKYLTLGKKGFIHGNRLRKPANTISDEIKSRVVQIYQEYYDNFNFTHFNEYLKSAYNINLSYTTVRNILTEAHIISPLCYHITKHKEKMYQKMLRKTKTVEVLKENSPTEIINKIPKQFSHSRVPRLKCFGEKLEMDASTDYWLDTEQKVTLHGAIDNCTGTIVGLYFDNQETLNGYYNLLNIILTDYGIPKMFLTDNRTVFIYNGEKNKDLVKDTYTQFSYTCKLLGIDIETTSIPEKKSRIERLWGTLQSRLKNDLHKAGICNIVEANEFVKQFIIKFNKQFATPIDYNTSLFEPMDLKHINYYLSVRTMRTFDKGCAIKYQNQYYLPFNGDQQVNYKNKTVCMVINTFDNKLYCNVDDEISELRPLEENVCFSKRYKPEPDGVKKEKKHYVPPLTHPFKLQSFLNYLNRKRKKGYYTHY